MASQPHTDEPPPPARRPRRIGCWALLALAILLVMVLAGVWLARERIAGNVIADELDKRGVHATYEIERIGTRTQILRKIVVGDPKRPDLTIARAIVRINPRFGIPTLGRITVIKPRLYGTYYRGKLSFGEMDKLLFTSRKKTPFELPDLDLAIEDGRALLETEFGRVAARIAGRGKLQDGFAGELAAIAPGLSGGGCELGRTTFYGRVVVADRQPNFGGPLRYARLRCPGSELASSRGTLQLNVKADEALKVFEGDSRVALGPSAFAYGLVASLRGTTRFTWRDGGLTARYDLAAAGVSADQVAVSRLDLAGTLRTRRMFERIELDSKVEGEGVRVGNGLDALLASAASSTQGTLAAPLLEQVRRQLAREGRSSQLTAQLSYRRTGQRTALSMPSAVLRGSSGATLLALSRFQLADGPNTAARLAGNFATGGAGLPRIVGNMELGERGRVQAGLAMAEYSAGGSRLALPELVLAQGADGGLGFAGQVRASGPLPGGRAENLVVPISGSYSRGTLAMWNECTPVRFDRLEYANLTLDRQSLTLCPTPGAPILRHGPAGLRLAVGATSLRLAGRLGQSPIAIRSGPVGFAYPGTLSARQLDVALGPPATAQRFLINGLTAKIGKDIAGRFDGTDVTLFSVPLNVLGAEGDWRYAGGRLALSNGSFRLEDRRDPDRFEPLVSSGASLTLANNIITADALLREPAGNRAVTRVDLRHDLATGRGFADLNVDGITFDRSFQPTALTSRAFGVVANVRGTIAGAGRVDWGPGGVTSTGRFSSDALDFAAAFGPVRGASGTLEFTDLLGLTTAPNQRLRVASVNPGIEVTDGEIEVQLRGGQVLALQGARWPFMGGTLTMRAVDVTFGASEVRRYVLEIEGLDAARFVERMELNNINATGIFDGTIPLVFGESGNGRVEGGVLQSRPPGGNISYIGALTYKDLSPMANLAFASLRSLDYKEMRIQMDGNLTGEIVTRVRFDGVSQGAGATQNIVTRAIAGLPIRFEVNIRAPFYSLLSSIKAMYDPSAIRDPRDLGLLDAQGNVLRRETNTPPPPLKPTDIIPDEALIQRRESEEMP